MKIILFMVVNYAPDAEVGVFTDTAISAATIGRLKDLLPDLDSFRPVPLGVERLFCDAHDRETSWS